jgi:hypothetical protein
MDILAKFIAAALLVWLGLLALLITVRMLRGDIRRVYSEMICEAIPEARSLPSGSSRRLRFRSCSSSTR